MPITRTPWTDDDGTGTTGTVINNSEKQILYNQIDAAIAALGVADTEQIVLPGGTYSPVVLSSAYRVHHVTTAGTTAHVGITGFTQGKGGDVVVVKDYCSGGWYTLLHHEHTGTSTTARLSNFVYSGATCLAPGLAGGTGGGTAIFVFDAYITRWRLIAHEQGSPITVPFLTGYYQGQGAFTAAMVKRHDWLLRGRQLTIAFRGENFPTPGTGTNLLVAGFPYLMDPMCTGDYYPAVVSWGFLMSNVTPGGGGEPAFQLLYPTFGAWPAGASYAYFEGRCIVK